MAEVPAKGLMPVEEALSMLLADARPVATETVALSEAAGRWLAGPITAKLNQPPFHASAMDGYAVQSADGAAGIKQYKVIGESAAGRRFSGAIKSGEAVRIFTGAPVPAGADAVVIQEDTVREGDQVLVREPAAVGHNVRPLGYDFKAGARLIEASRRLTARDLMLAASGGHMLLSVLGRPKVAVLATGDELVFPGETPGPDQIVSSIPYGLKAMFDAAGAETELIGIARDTLESLDQAIGRAAAADVLVTIGGASVGDHDLVHKALSARGMTLAFWKIAMRPGKPLMSGRLGRQHVLGLPGNPVSATLCARIFGVPLIRALAGRNAADTDLLSLILETGLPANGPRQHYVRARRLGREKVEPLPQLDSSLLSVLAAADCLIVQLSHASAALAGSLVDVLPLDF